MLITKLNESYLKISDVEYDEAKFINDQFSFYAENYRFHPSFKMKRWDGKIRLFNMRNMTIPIGCYDKLISLCKNAGIFVSSEGVVTEEVSIDEVSVNQMLKDDFNCDLILRDYQTDAVINSIRNNKCISLLPTASGKSFLQFAIINYLLKHGHVNKVLLIVPTVSLVSQMEFDFLDYAKNVKNYSKNLQTIYSGRTKEINSRIVISTWQSLQELVSDEETEWFEQFDCLMVDECLHPDTLVMMSDRTQKKIKDIEQGDLILTLNQKTEKIEINKVIKKHKNLFNSYSEKRYKISTDDGRELIITGNHKVYTNNGQKRVDELREGDEIISI